MPYFGVFSKKLKPCVKFSRVLTNHIILCGIFEKIFKDFFDKSTKNALFRFFKIISKPWVKFSRVLRKNNCFGNFLKNFQKYLCK